MGGGKGKPAVYGFQLTPCFVCHTLQIRKYFLLAVYGFSMKKKIVTCTLCDCVSQSIKQRPFRMT